MNNQWLANLKPGDPVEVVSRDRKRAVAARVHKIVGNRIFLSSWEHGVMVTIFNRDTGESFGWGLPITDPQCFIQPRRR